MEPMEKIEAFFNMGGYAGFVWPSFAISAICLLSLYVWSQSKLKSIENKLSAAEQERPNRRRGTSAPSSKGTT
ncbi:heme exporter protein CcmD [Sneathiella sp.]|uniref:heme exporter protein CcmD n=1 Tax=Sneathiella sp. TaxID=1964365 RepID=UPI003FA6DF3F